MLVPVVVVVVVVVLLLLQQRLVNQQLSSSITKAIISPVVRDSLLSLSKTAYSKSKYSRLVVIFIENPLCLAVWLQTLFFYYNMRQNARTCKL